jgi:hypothetical protein
MAAKDEQQHVITREGDAIEGYVIAKTSDLDWVSAESLVIGDEDYIVSKGMANRLCGYVNLSGKAKKALLGEDEHWAKFKKIFAAVANTLQEPIVLKTCNGEIVGIVPSSFDRRTNAYLQGSVLPKINGKKGLKQVFAEFTDNDTTVVYVSKDLPELEFAGQKWHHGVTFAYSTTGQYGPSLTPTLVPVTLNPFILSLPSSMEELIFYPDNITQLEGEMDAAHVAQSCAVSCGAMAERWEKALSKDLSLYEYERLMNGLLGNKDTQPEYQLIGRLAMAYEAHELDVEAGRPAKAWLQTAWSGTNFGQFLSVALSIGYDVGYHYSPTYAIGNQCESVFGLDLVANNRRPSLAKLEWTSPKE